MQITTEQIQEIQDELQWVEDALREASQYTSSYVIQFLMGKQIAYRKVIKILKL